MKISLREQLMLICFVFVCLLIWASEQLDKRDVVNEEHRDAQKELKLQKVWLDNVDSIDAKVKRTLEPIDREKTLSGPELMERMDAMARALGVKYELSPHQTEAGEVFRHYRGRILLQNVNIAQLVDLEDKIDKEYPYLSLDRMSLSANRVDSSLLNVSLNVSSFELLKEKL